jgi:hypothetical protein
MIRKNRLKYVPIVKLVRDITSDRDEFLQDLAERLLLDEVLAGEADPKEFLKQTMLDIIDDYAVKSYERIISEIRGGAR